MEKRCSQKMRMLLSLLLALGLMIALLPMATAEAHAATKVYYSWPTNTHTISGNWGKQSGHKFPYHYGIDIAAKSGSKVYAAAPGTVVYAGYDSGYGYHIRIRHADGQETLYAHNKKNLVKKGAKVKRGQVIAYVGNSGASYGAHLHFGIYRDKNAFSKEWRSHPAASTITRNPRDLLKTYTVTFKSGVSDGSVSNVPAKGTRVYNQYLDLTALRKPVRPGYAFAGWKNLTDGKIYQKGLYIGGNRTFVAQWESLTSYRVTFRPGADDGSVKNLPADRTLSDGSYLNLANTEKPTRTGYRFVGWRNDRNQNLYVKGIYVHSAETFTAEWESIHTGPVEPVPDAGKLVSEAEYQALYADNPAFYAVPYYRYATRTAAYITNGYPTDRTYTAKTVKSVYGTPSYGSWAVGAPSTSTVNGSKYQTVVTRESLTAYVSYAYYTSDKQKCWKAKNGGVYPNSLKIYSSKDVKKAGYKKDADGSYVLPRALSMSSPGKLGAIYRFSYAGKYTSSFTAGSRLGHIYVWPEGTVKMYRPVTTKYQYTHYRYGAWSAWSDWTPEVRTTSDIQKRDETVMYFVTNR